MQKERVKKRSQYQWAFVSHNFSSGLVQIFLDVAVSLTRLLHIRNVSFTLGGCQKTHQTSISADFSRNVDERIGFYYRTVYAFSVLKCSLTGRPRPQLGRQ